MKCRLGFVSNSSSSSFLVRREKVSDEQLNKILNHIAYGKEVGIGSSFDYQDEWRIEIDNEWISGNCFMDNFDMEEFLLYIGIDGKDIFWGECY